jgi:acyl carrier protein
MMSTELNIDDRELRALIADVLDIEPEAITDEVSFVEDLGVDSLLALELAVTMERRYGFKVESHEMGDVRTMHEVRALISKKLADHP